MVTNSVNHIVVITGASSGIGLAVAKKAALNEQCVVIMVAKNEEKLVAAKSQLVAAGYLNVEHFTADITINEQVTQLFKFIQKIKLPVYGFVHCAGTMYESPLLMTRDHLVDEQYHQHVKSAIMLAQGISKIMARNKSGSIVFISSVVAQQGSRGQSVYAAMKSALHGLTASLAAELGTMNIRVNAVAPGVIDTALVAHIPDEKKQQLIKNTALGRIGQPEEVADVINFLFAEESRFITGQVIHVDGGLKLGL
ncbi:SDR family oxidoreductase [Pseudoalteromonas peptidolytica]|nr:SDR family oxidoreductase [Pseudoalteromonas peptidolytica]